ncbi:MAG: helix-turn-helix domain-containing protein [Candidatus Omnitrophota bacterium]
METQDNMMGSIKTLTKDQKKIIGERLRHFLSYKNLSIAKSAKLLNSSQTDIIQLIGGKINPEKFFELAKALHNKLNLDLNWLLTGKGYLYEELIMLLNIPNVAERVFRKVADLKIIYHQEISEIRQKHSQPIITE